MGGTLSLGNLLRRPEAGTLLGLIVVYAVFSILGGANFVGTAGLSSWLNICAEVGIIALPVGLLMIAGYLDISVGSIVPASSLSDDVNGECFPVTLTETPKGHHRCIRTLFCLHECFPASWRKRSV